MHSKLTGHEHTVWTVTALPDGRVVSGSYDKTLKVWDLNKPKGDECIAQQLSKLKLDQTL